jgi:hypothetical protein
VPELIKNLGKGSSLIDIAAKLGKLRH